MIVKNNGVAYVERPNVPVWLYVLLSTQGHEGSYLHQILGYLTEGEVTEVERYYAEHRHEIDNYINQQNTIAPESEIYAFC